MGPYKPVRNWVDDHPLLYGNNGSLDPSTINHKQSSIHTVNIPLSHGSYRSKHHFSIYNPPVFKTNGSTPKKLGVFVFLDVFSFFQGTKNIQIPCFPSFFFSGCVTSNDLFFLQPSEVEAGEKPHVTHVDFLQSELRFFVIWCSYYSLLILKGVSVA